MGKKPVLNQDLKESAKAMIGYGFWKHLEKFMIEMATEATEYEDRIPHGSITPGDIGYARGVRSSVKRIREEVEQYLL